MVVEPPEPHAPTRRMLLAAGAALLTPGLARAAPGSPPGGALAFAVFRNGVRVGDHAMTFTGAAGAMTIVTRVAMTVRLGPVPVYRYSHRATERWSGGQFVGLETVTDGGGRKQSVSARRTAGGIVIQSGAGRVEAPATALPLTHWNPAALAGPLFNPQEGKLLKVSARRVGREAVKRADGGRVDAVRWTLTGEAQIDDWYDDAGTWVALRGKLPDGSTMEYRRL